MPSDWKDLTLEAICSRITDGAHASPPSVVSGKPMASVKDLTNSGIRLESCRRISTEDYEKLVRQGCQPTKGDVLIAKDGATALDTVCEVKRNEDVVLLSSVAILRPDPEIITSSFLRYYLDAPATRKYLKASFVSGAAIPRVVLKDLKKAKVSVPPLVIQNRISSILSPYDDLVENSERRVQLLASMVRSLYKEWFVNFRFPGHELLRRNSSSLGEIPDGWEARKLGDLCVRLESGGTPKRSNPDYWAGGEIEWYKTGELWDGFLFGSKEKISVRGQRESTARLFEPGTILMAIYGSPTVGRMGILTDFASCNQAALGLVADKRFISQAYLFCALYSLRDHFNGLAQGAAQQNISKEKVSSALILVPQRETLRLFDRVAVPIFEEIKALQKEIGRVRDVRELLLSKLISGQLNIESLAA